MAKISLEVPQTIDYIVSKVRPTHTAVIRRDRYDMTPRKFPGTTLISSYEVEIDGTYKFLWVYEA